MTCDYKMRVFLPKPRLPVLVGPPAPPAPTIVQFDRNVVVLRGQADDQPDQLTCDTLKLTMVPSETAPAKQATPEKQSTGLEQSAPDKQAAPGNAGCYRANCLQTTIRLPSRSGRKAKRAASLAI